MQKEIAKQVTSIMIECCKRLEESIDLVSNACGDEDQARKEAMEFRGAVGKIMGHVFVEVLHPIYQRHPELEPDELKSQRR
jgi:hypothetical protein